MARTIRNSKLDSRSARSKLGQRKEPYWAVITKGCALGYRKLDNGGTWIARFRDDIGKQHYKALGAADDAIDVDADSTLCLAYASAQRKAEDFFKQGARGFDEDGLTSRVGAYTVKDALDDYMTSYKKRGGKSEQSTQSTINALIVPKLGTFRLDKLTSRRLEAWLTELAGTPARLRTKSGEAPKYRDVEDNAETTRRRRSSANRVLTVLKAALNKAYQERKVMSDEAWRSVQPFKEVSGSRIKYLDDKQSKRLVNASSPEFRPLVQAALLTGCRYSELTALIVRDYDKRSGKLHIRISKAGKPRHITLSEEGQQHFDNMAAGKGTDALIFQKANKMPWSKSHQHRPFKEACKAAKVGALTFHELRHTYASRLIMNGAPLPVIAAQLGHTGTRMVEKHYGHMTPSYVTDTVRAAFPTIGIVKPWNVVKFANSKAI